MSYPDEVIRDAVWLAKLARGSSWPGGQWVDADELRDGES